MPLLPNLGWSCCWSLPSIDWARSGNTPLTGGQVIANHTHTQFCETRMRDYVILQMVAVAVAGSEFRHLLFHVIMFWIDSSHLQVPLQHKRWPAPKSVYQHKIHTAQIALWLRIQVRYVFPGAVYHLFWHCCQQHYHFSAHTVTNVLKQHSHSAGLSLEQRL